MAKYDKGIKRIEDKLKSNKSRQLDNYYRKILIEQNLSTKVDVPSAVDDDKNIIMFKFFKTHIIDERQQYNHAKRLFDSIYRCLPSAIFKHFTMLIIEHDRKFNKYGDLI